MVQKLESIRGGGGSIRIGTTGKVSALMTRELDSVTAALPRTPPPSKPGTVPVSIPCSASTPGRLQQLRRSLDEGSTSRNKMSPRSHARSSQRVPMLRSDDATSCRGRRGVNIVEVVDVKCGNPDRAWASPIASRLKKLGFSKLSESVM